MQTISYPTHIDADLLPDSRLALVMTAVSILGIQFDVEVVAYTIIIFVLSSFVSLWFSLTSDTRSSLVVFETRFKLLVGYVIGALLMVLLAAVLDNPPGVQRFAFAVIAGIETAFGLATLARMLPTFRPVYLSIMHLLYTKTPLDEWVDREINDLIDDTGRDDA